MRYIILLIVLSLLLFGSMNSDVQKITPWLLGANFTIAIFSINFTFFGYQLSKYKAIYSEISKRQWANIVALLSLPFAPLISYLVIPDYFGIIALLILPVLVFSAIDNASLTDKYISPKFFIDKISRKKVIDRYLIQLSRELEKEVEKHKSYTKDREKYQIPAHGYSFEPTTLGLENEDIWDSITVVVNLSIENNDYPVFRKSLSSVLNTVVAFYSFKTEVDDGCRIDDGVKFIARNRLRSIITNVIEKDKSRMFLQTLSSEFCSFLMKENVINDPCSDLTRSIVSDCIWIGKKCLNHIVLLSQQKY
ncbi:hypothetical protein [Marinomonas fungiae]|uniref:Uncharacterized protein n=1 Tax=Marinomonas fungiae TaxID=1137284 RepID=A0A0K6IIX9_9GAMM|nr:hypothetical protein [Marinomonas fungiae]CUB03282.1 hypothetical protein Ga0061065_103132 [Marinomonas fungiae]